MVGIRTPVFRDWKSRRTQDNFDVSNDKSFGDCDDSLSFYSKGGFFNV